MSSKVSGEEEEDDEDDDIQFIFYISFYNSINLDIFLYNKCQKAQEKIAPRVKSETPKDDALRNVLPEKSGTKQQVDVLKVLKVLKALKEKVLKEKVLKEKVLKEKVKEKAHALLEKYVTRKQVDV